MYVSAKQQLLLEFVFFLFFFVCWFVCCKTIQCFTLLFFILIVNKNDVKNKSHKLLGNLYFFYSPKSQGVIFFYLLLACVCVCG